MSKLLDDKFWADWEREGIANGNLADDPEWCATASKTQLDEAFENNRKRKFKIDGLSYERNTSNREPINIVDHSSKQSNAELDRVRELKDKFKLEGLSYSARTGLTHRRFEIDNSRLESKASVKG